MTDEAEALNLIARTIPVVDRNQKRIAYALERLVDVASAANRGEVIGEHRERTCSSCGSTIVPAAAEKCPACDCQLKEASSAAGQ